MPLTYRAAHVAALLDQLEEKCADELEGQDLDFKEWDSSSMNKSVRTVVDMAVCMANGGGGTVVFGVKDKVVGRTNAVIGIPNDVDVDRLKRAVYDRTDPKITPSFVEMTVPEGTGRILVMEINDGLPPHTDSSGRGTIRVGSDCQPLTGTVRRTIAVERGESDFTAGTIDGELGAMLSPSALAQLREASAAERVPDDFLRLSDVELLENLRLTRNGRLTRAGLLLAGRADAIARHVDKYRWTFLRMRSDVEYDDRLDGHDALPLALQQIEARLMAHNPLTTVHEGLFHFEYRVYPEIALREALLNAFAHADFQVHSPIMIKLYPDRLEISNPGRFVGGISPSNVLHHPPVARNPLLVDALQKLRLVNRSNLGVPRMFREMLSQGKEPPVIEELGNSVRLVFRASEFSAAFRTFLEEQHAAGVNLSVDHLLILHFLTRRAEIDTGEAARICQRSEDEARERLSRMELELGLLERGGGGRGTYWRLRSEVHERLEAGGDAERDRRISWDAAKTRILSVLSERAKAGEGMSNEDVRRIAALDRFQATRLLNELRDEHGVYCEGDRRWARWFHPGARNTEA